jgi:hypothetical protein
MVAVGADLDPYEAKVRTASEPDTLDMVQARSDSDARIVLRQRYPGCTIVALRRLEQKTGYQWYVARASVAGVNVVDTALAKGSGQARRIFAARFPKCTIVSLMKLPPTERYSLYTCTLHSADRKVFEDAIFADGSGSARKALLARYPGARISSITEVKGASR